jgi:uncharacterized lipoprotein YddW (UPF0748 family)
MSKQKQEAKGCGCANIPLSVIIVFLGCGYWLFSQRNKFDFNYVYQVFPQLQNITLPLSKSQPQVSSLPTPNENTNSVKKTPQKNENAIVTTAPSTQPTPTAVNISPQPKPETVKSPVPQQQKEFPTAWQKKVIRGIYLSRYHATNNASEKMIRERVRYYKSQGFNTLIHGVWGNGCPMYHSQVMQETMGYKSCRNVFREKWLDWLIDEAHQQGMEVHAYFERGIKIDKKSPIYKLALERKWLVPGVDKTYVGLEQYILDVGNSEVANFLTDTLVEFVKRYPQIDAVQWDDYLAYYAELPGNEDRTPKLTKFAQDMIFAMKTANPNVSFDICHHNPYWAKRYFAADWKKWNVDRAFIQAYNDKNFQDELNYAQQYDGIAISEKQFHRLKQVVNNPNVKSVLIFPLDGKPKLTATNLKQNLND